MTNYQSADKTAGFTLVELSIVIIIIGILVSGISAGSALIKQARLNKTIQELQSYDVATRLFTDKYNYFPGDFPNASSLWPGAFNGNGNRGIDWTWFIAGDESFATWQHLGFAGLIQQHLNDLPNNPNFATPDFKVGVNVPASSYSESAVYSIISNPQWSNYSSFAPYIIIVGSQAVNNVGPWTVVSVLDAYNIDNKLDNGNPFNGKVISWDPGTDACTNYDLPTLNGTSVPSNPQYQLTNQSQNACVVSYALYDYTFKGLGK